MNEIQEIVAGNVNIESVDFRNEPSIPGVSITFKNGIIMSIIWGEFAHGSEKSPYEIAFIDNRNGGDWMPQIFDANDAGDDVAGYMNADDVRYYIEQAIAFRA